MVRPNRRPAFLEGSPAQPSRTPPPLYGARRERAMWRDSTAIVVERFQFEDNFCLVRSDPVPDLRITLDVEYVTWPSRFLEA